MLGIFLFSVFMYFVFSFAIKIFVKNEISKLEIHFFKICLEYHTLKYQMLQMLELIYDKASESDPKYLEDYEKIKLKLEENFNNVCNEFVINLNNSLGYKTPYNNWNELITYASLLYTKKIKEWNRKQK